MGNVAQLDRGSDYFSWNNLTVGGSTPPIPLPYCFFGRLAEWLKQRPAKASLCKWCIGSNPISSAIVYASHCVLSNKKKVNKNYRCSFLGINKFLQVMLIFFLGVFPNGEGGDCNSPANACRFDSYHTHHYFK